MNSQPLPPILDAEGVAALLQCSARTAEDHARAGTLPSVKFGEGWIFPTAALLEAVNRMAIDEAAKRTKDKAPPAPAGTLQPRQPAAKRRPDLTLLSQAR